MSQKERHCSLQSSWFSEIFLVWELNRLKDKTDCRNDEIHNALQVTLSFSYFQGDLTSTWPSFVEPSQSKYMYIHHFFPSTAALLPAAKGTCVPIAKRKHPLLDWNRKSSTLLNITTFTKPEVQEKELKMKASDREKNHCISFVDFGTTWKSISLRENSVRRWYDSLCYGVMSYLQNDIYNIEHLPLCCPYMIQKLTFHLFSFPLNAVLLEGIGYN